MKVSLQARNRNPELPSTGTYEKVDLVYQEAWGLLLGDYIIHRQASQAVVAFCRAPSDVRFKPACQYIAVQLIVMAAANPISAMARRLVELRGGLAGCFWITILGQEGPGR